MGTEVWGALSSRDSSCLPPPPPRQGLQTLHTLASLIPALLEPSTPLPGRPDTAHQKPASSPEVGGWGGSHRRDTQRLGRQRPCLGHTTAPPPPKGKVTADQGTTGSRRGPPRDSARDLVASGAPRVQGPVSSRRRRLARGQRGHPPRPPVPSVGRNNLRDTIDISTLYNNIS